MGSCVVKLCKKFPFILFCLRKLGTFRFFDRLSLSLSVPPWWGLSVQVNCSPKWSPTAAKEGIFTPSLMSFILSLTPSSVLYCFKATLWEIQWATSHLCQLLSLSLRTRLLAHLQWYIYHFSKAGEYLGNISKLHRELFHYCCLQGFECEHESKIFTAYTVRCSRCDAKQQPILSLCDVSVSCFSPLICHPSCAAKRQPGGRG